METATFVPKLPNQIDKVAKLIRTLSQVFLLATLILSVLFFIPTTVGLVLFPKVYFVLFGCLVSFIFATLVVLRSGSITVRFNPLLLSWGLLVLAGMLSALLSPNLASSLFGDALEIHTVGFLALLGLVMFLVPMVGNSKKFTLYLYGSFVISTIGVSLVFLFRVLFGADFLPLPLLQVLTDNYVGSFNDLGIFVGGIVMVGLVALAQLDLPKKGLIFIGSLLTLLLLVLASVNFFFVWLLLALFSLLLLMYVLTKDRFGVAADAYRPHAALPLTSIGLIGLVFLVSVTFLIGGNALGTTLSTATGVSYIEIRPSLAATGDIFRPIYAQQALTGIGPNRFAEAWNLYKDGSINETFFWNTTFTAGGGYIPTWFVTAGLMGAVAWILFLGAFIYTGLRTLLANKVNDSFWFFIGTVSFVGGLFIWIMAFVYVPGPMILLLGAICTGSLVVTSQKLLPMSGRTFNLLSSSKTGFILIAAVMICIITTLFVGYGALKQVSAAYLFNTASKNIASDNTNAVEIISNRIATAYALYPTDTYARSLSGYQFSYLNTLLSLAEPTAAQQQQFQSAISAALNASTQAIALKPTDARNWQMLADIYAALSLLNIEGAKDRAFESYAEAEKLDPKNPQYVLQKAAMEARSNNTTEARRLAALALQLKPNFTDALYLLSELDIAAGDITTAIAMTQSIISIEVNNPGRYYQLGVLYSAIKNTEAAIASFTEAIKLDQNYANARYFRAQQYLIAGQTDTAISELEIVRDLSADNRSVNDLISKIKSGEVTAKTLTEPQTVSEASGVTTENDVTTTSAVPDSDLLTPVNNGAAPKSGAATVSNTGVENTPKQP